MAQFNNNEKSTFSASRGKRLSETSFFSSLIKRATKFLGAPAKLFLLISNAYKKTDNIDSISGVTSKLKTQIIGLYDLVVDYAKGNYTALELKDVTLILAGIIYLVSPLDFVPDFIPFVGLLDDISILSWIITKLSEEIDTYLLWKKHGIIKVKKEAEENVPTIIEIE